MIRLSFDVEIRERGITMVPLPEEPRDDIEDELRARLLELVASNRDVVLEFSFWSRQMREDHPRHLAPTGVLPETIHLVADRETVLERIRARRGEASRRLRSHGRAGYPVLRPFRAAYRRRRPTHCQPRLSEGQRDATQPLFSRSERRRDDLERGWAEGHDPRLCDARWRRTQRRHRGQDGVVERPSVDTRADEREGHRRGTE